MRFRIPKQPNKKIIQYISDLHVDMKENGYVPIFPKTSDILVVCGDIGLPTHPNYELLLNCLSYKYEKTYIIPGNHDFDCGPMFEQKKYDKYSEILKYICSKYPNIIYTDKSSHEIDNNYVLAGCVLWSKPQFQWSRTNFSELYHTHVREHVRNLSWLTNIITSSVIAKKKLIVATHFVPSYELIEEKFRNYGKTRTSWFYTDLDHIIKKPIHAWICGHTHSQLNKLINGVYCGVNAYPKNGRLDITSFTNSSSLYL